jgi:hypothetical protein
MKGDILPILPLNPQKLKKIAIIRAKCQNYYSFWWRLCGVEPLAAISCSPYYDATLPDIASEQAGNGTEVAKELDPEVCFFLSLIITAFRCLNLFFRSVVQNDAFHRLYYH